jgi:predicted ATP-dependent serine protease
MATERCQRASNVLLGRSNESKVLEDLLAAARRGEGGATVVYGEPGIGKTALIEHIVSLAAEFNVLRTAGNEAEIELAYAGLQELLRAQREELEELPDPQRRAIETALGRAAGIAPDRLLLGLGVLNLVSLVSAKRPVLCVIDARGGDARASGADSDWPRRSGCAQASRQRPPRAA